AEARSFRHGLAFHKRKLIRTKGNYTYRIRLIYPL
ncbi:MAG: hypothetical protein ACI9XB_002754, partial [Gammaproteobacteria bacterium]